MPYAQLNDRNEQEFGVDKNTGNGPLKKNYLLIPCAKTVAAAAFQQKVHIETTITTCTIRKDSIEKRMLKEEKNG